AAGSRPCAPTTVNPKPAKNARNAKREIAFARFAAFAFDVVGVVNAVVVRGAKASAERFLISVSPETPSRCECRRPRRSAEDPGAAPADRGPPPSACRRRCGASGGGRRAWGGTPRKR